MKLHILSPLEVFLTEKVKKPDLYIILEGKVFIRSKTKEESVLDSYDIFGYTAPFTNQKWVPSRVTTREMVSIISIPRGPLKKALEKVKKFQDNTKLLEFLVKTVPGVRQLGQAGKERILSFFERTHFKNGDILLREGEKSAHAYIIEEGECKIVGSQNPLKRPGSAPARGLMSKTTSCFNLGLAMAGEWVGEDSILLAKPLDFSVIASSHMSALRITREKFLENLSRDTQNTLRENLVNKFKWREQRKQNISHAILENVIDDEGIAEVASYKDAEKNYPKASKIALVNIRNQEFEKNELMEKASLANFSSANLGVDEGYATKAPTAKPSRPQTGKIRPTSAVTDHFARSAYGPSASSKNFLFSQPIYQKNSQVIQPLDRVGPEKVQLYSAGTLGYTLVPVLVRRPQTAKPKAATASNLKIIRQSIQVPTGLTNFETFAQKVRRGRPSSPNPAEVWAKKQGVALRNMNLLNVEDL